MGPEDPDCKRIPDFCLPYEHIALSALVLKVSPLGIGDSCIALWCVCGPCGMHTFCYDLFLLDPILLVPAT